MAGRRRKCSMDLCNEFVESEARMSGSFAGPRPVPTVSAHIIKKSLGQSRNSPKRRASSARKRTARTSHPPPRRAFLRSYSSGRFITISLLDAAWDEGKRVQRDAMRLGLLNQISDETAESPLAAFLDRMDDAGIDALYQQDAQRIRSNRQKATGRA